MAETPPVGGTSGSSDRSAQSGADTTMSFGSPDAVVEDTRVRVGLTSEESGLVAALPTGSALLIGQRGPGSGLRFLLDTDETVAGRGERSDIFLDDVTVSRRHAVFVRELGDYRVRDVGSLNGTYVNSERIDDVLLTDGDEVQIGKYRLVYHTRPQSRAGESAAATDESRGTAGE